MIVRKIKTDNAPVLIVNKDEKIEEVLPLEYVISIESKNKYDNQTELLITKLLLNGIKVYQYTSSSHTLEFDCNKILSSNDSIIVIVTYDESKFEMLQNTIKEFMITHKDGLN